MTKDGERTGEKGRCTEQKAKRTIHGCKPTSIALEYSISATAIPANMRPKASHDRRPDSSRSIYPCIHGRLIHWAKHPRLRLESTAGYVEPRLD
eukprot:scaffold116173_cov30-Prasinocladus_malaysianus.AAC.1